METVATNFVASRPPERHCTTCSYSFMILYGVVLPNKDYPSIHCVEAVPGRMGDYIRISSSHTGAVIQDSQGQ